MSRRIDGRAAEGAHKNCRTSKPETSILPLQERNSWLMAA
jgi:hypothetical protein